MMTKQDILTAEFESPFFDKIVERTFNELTSHKDYKDAMKVAQKGQRPAFADFLAKGAAEMHADAALEGQRFLKSRKTGRALEDAALDAMIKKARACGVSKALRGLENARANFNKATENLEFLIETV